MVLGSHQQQAVPDSAVPHFLYVSCRWEMQHFLAGCSFKTCIVPSNKQGEKGGYKDSEKKKNKKKKFD